MQSNTILEVKNLNVELDGEKILENLSFNLREKENLVVMGPNGAGKSVLLKALLGIIPFSGEVKWSKNAKISYVPQKFFPSKEIPLNVKEFFKFKNASWDEAEKWLGAVGLTGEILKKQIGSLSAGQFQRLMIAWALVGNPDVLFFDEPTAGIDIGGEETIYNLLAKIEKQINLTMVLVTHDLNLVYKFADNVLCLNKGAACYGAPAQALTAESLKKLYGEAVGVYKHEHI